MKLNVVVPNLDRRQDRWYFCLGWLKARGFSDANIERFSAHDGDDYENIEAAREAALKQFPNSAYLDQNVAKHYYCWSWTWYDIMTNIAAQSQEGIFTLALVDDWIANFNYDEICEHIRFLRGECDSLKMIQYVESSQVPGHYKDEPLLPVGDVVPGLPYYRRGLTKSGDAANMLSPVGAREILAVANQPERGVPNWVFWHAARELDSQDGYFSPAKPPLFRPIGSLFINKFQDGRQQ